MSIARKLLATTLLIVGVAVAAILLLTWNTTANKLRELEVKRIADSVESEARMLQSSINMVKSDMAMLAEGSARHITDRRFEDLQSLSDQLDMMMRERPTYRQARMMVKGASIMRVLDSTRIGNAVNTQIDPPITNLDYKAMLAQRQGLTNFSVHATSLAGQDPGEKVLFVSMPIRSKEQDVVGAIAVTVSIDQVIREHVHPYSDIAYWVADSAGNYLYQSRPESAAKTQLEPANAVRDFQLAASWDRLLSGVQPHVIVELPSSVTLGISRVRLDSGEENGQGSTLIVGATKSLTDMGAKAAAVQEPLTVVVIGVGILMVMALFVASRRILSPIHDLARAADQIATGSRDVAVPVGGNDEIGTLGRAMMRMADEFRKAGKNSEQSAMGQMASMIAHDLRNALSSVKMNLQILESHHQKEGNSEIDNCETALGQVRYMETILNDMLTFARPGTAEFDWVDLGDTIKTASISLFPEMQGKSINFQMEGEHKLPTIMADRNKLLQLFQNLLINAIQAVPEWGHISIKARCLLHESRPSVEVRIEDDGPGISPEIIDRVFDPFFTTSARGTGLGLAIVQRIIRQHGGRIYIDPAANHGTTVVVLLPLTQGEQAQDGAEAETGEQTGNPLTIVRLGLPQASFKCSNACPQADQGHCALKEACKDGLPR